jgi:hypothetical protein
MALAVDGAIVRAQIQAQPDDALASLSLLLKALNRAGTAG